MYTIDLKKFRKDNGLKQSDVALYFACDQSFISQIENGKSKIPDSYISKILADNSINKDSLECIEDLEDESNIGKLINIMQKQVDSLSIKDEQINRLITIIEKKL